MTQELLDAYRQERHEVVHRIFKNRRNFFRAIEFVGEIIYEDTETTINQLAKQSGKGKDLQEYIERRLDEFLGT